MQLYSCGIKHAVVHCVLLYIASVIPPPTHPNREANDMQAKELEEAAEKLRTMKQQVKEADNKAAESAMTAELAAGELHGHIQEKEALHDKVVRLQREVNTLTNRLRVWMCVGCVMCGVCGVVCVVQCMCCPSCQPPCMHTTIEPYIHLLPNSHPHPY